MSKLTIEGLDADLMRGLERMAERNHLSISAQAEQLLKHAAGKPGRNRRVEIATSIAALTPLISTHADSAALVREDRDR